MYYYFIFPLAHTYSPFNVLASPRHFRRQLSDESSIALLETLYSCRETRMRKQEKGEKEKLKHNQQNVAKTETNSVAGYSAFLVLFTFSASQVICLHIWTKTFIERGSKNTAVFVQQLFSKAFPFT